MLIIDIKVFMVQLLWYKVQQFFLYIKKIYIQKVLIRFEIFVKWSYLCRIKVLLNRMFGNYDLEHCFKTRIIVVPTYLFIMYGITCENPMDEIWGARVKNDTYEYLRELLWRWWWLFFLLRHFGLLVCCLQQRIVKKFKII